jgi:hypothetical protein
MSDEKPKARPGEYTAELGDAIWDRLLDGEGIRTICADPGMPDRATFYRWLREHKEFRAIYSSACSLLANRLGHEMYRMAFAEPEQAELLPGGQIVRTTVTAQNCALVRIRIEVRKWVMAQLLQYADLAVRADEAVEQAQRLPTKHIRSRYAARTNRPPGTTLVTRHRASGRLSVLLTP